MDELCQIRIDSFSRPLDIAKSDGEPGPNRGRDESDVRDRDRKRDVDHDRRDEGHGGRKYDLGRHDTEQHRCRTDVSDSYDRHRQGTFNPGSFGKTKVKIQFKIM